MSLMNSYESLSRFFYGEISIDDIQNNNRWRDFYGKFT